MSIEPIQFVAQLEDIIRRRIADGCSDSYTVSLAAAGSQRIAQKLGEEGVELALAAVAGDRKDIVNEAADLIYHLLVLLVDQDLSFQDIDSELRSRHGET